MLQGPGRSPFLYHNTPPHTIICVCNNSYTELNTHTCVCVIVVVHNSTHTLSDTHVCVCDSNSTHTLGTPSLSLFLIWISAFQTVHIHGEFSYIGLFPAQPPHLHGYPLGSFLLLYSASSSVRGRSYMRVAGARRAAC